jgi:integrase
VRGDRGALEADKLLRNILRRALRRAGLPELRFHDLRHMAASLMFEAGMSIKRTQETSATATSVTSRILSPSLVRATPIRHLLYRHGIGRPPQRARSL